MLISLIRLLRVKQWIKNLFVFGPLVFALRFESLPDVWRSVIMFVAFCLCASFVYIMNDIMDRDHDRHHPKKCKRPIASGDIKLPLAISIAVLVLGLGLGSAFWLLNLSAVGVLAVYVGMNVLYSRWFKHLIIVDVVIIAIGFILRVLAGTVAIDVVLSSWMAITVFFISLLLGFGKRRSEFMTASHQSAISRPSLHAYTRESLDAYILISVALTLISVTLYSRDPEVMLRFHSPLFVYTNVFVVIGLFRYLHLLFCNQGTDDPTELLLADQPLILTCCLWLFSVLWIIKYH